MIIEADSVVFILSRASARSDTCAWEVDEATRLGKRIFPIVGKSLGNASLPVRLQELQRIFFYPEPDEGGSGFGAGLKRLVIALNTDFEWLREHTRYLQRATEWDTRGRKPNRLLIGDDISEAKYWVARWPKTAPEPTDLHRDFIHASEVEAEARLTAERGQVEELTAAKAAVEEALRNADEQRREAEARKNQAYAILASATSVIASFQNQLDESISREAFAVFQSGAEIGAPEAMRNLGVAYAKGWGGAKDYLKACEWWEKAAHAGDADAMGNLGALYRDGNGVARDYATAREWFEKAAEQGHAEAMGNLGAFYYDGRGVPPDAVKAREWFEMAAAAGDSEAMRNLGVIHHNGEGVAQDYAKAREWYDKAAENGDVKAMNNIGLLYAKRGDAEQDYVKAVEWFEKAAAEGDAEAMANLGAIYHTGEGVPQDYSRAREWFEKAVVKGNPEAMVRLGVLYYDGHGVAPDYAKARHWFEAAAEKDNADGMLRLGGLYTSGHGVAQDDAEARRWYEKAAARNSAAAMFILGALSDGGVDGEQDYAKARHWYALAAESGNLDAMRGLGALYENGQGVAQDRAKAREWYEKAADKGDANAVNALEHLAVEEATDAGRFADALRLAEGLAAKTEMQETQRDGKPAVETANEHHNVAWRALLAGDFHKALAAVQRAHELVPAELWYEPNRAHALMFLGRADEAEAIYISNRGERLSDGRSWERGIADDFGEFRKAGLSHPMMGEIEKRLGLSS